MTQELQALYHLTLAPIKGRSHQERLESFYARQADHYDASRAGLLHGREELYRQLPVPAGGTWVEMGGGTGANLERLGPALRTLRQAVVVDLSAALLNVARERGRRLGWDNVRLLHEDVTKLQLAEPADVVTFSYSLTMIPDWFLALETARRLLRPGGLIGVVDFYVARKHPAAGMNKHAAFTRWFWPAWFSCDNVFPSPDHLPYLRQHFDMVSLTEHWGRLKYVPLFKVPYFVFVGRKPVTSGLEF